MLPFQALSKSPVIGQENEMLLDEEMKSRGKKKKKKVLFYLESRLMTQLRSTVDSRQNFMSMNELSNTLGSAEQEQTFAFSS